MPRGTGIFYDHFTGKLVSSPLLFPLSFWVDSPEHSRAAFQAFIKSGRRKKRRYKQVESATRYKENIQPSKNRL